MKRCLAALPDRGRRPTAQVSLKRQHDNTTITVDVTQGWSRSFALICVIALPLLCVGVSLLALTVLFAFKAKPKITASIQKALDEVAEELG
jgi:hypothetical protein